MITKFFKKKDWFQPSFSKNSLFNVCYLKQKYYLCTEFQTLLVMKRQLLPKQQRMLKEMGNQIKLARLRRNITSQEMAERTSLGRNTIVNIEAGSESVAMGSYFRVLVALGLDNDILKLAKDDILGRKLQDANLMPKKRAKSE